jgi:ADP-ribose pyrophosphatase
MLPKHARKVHDGVIFQVYQWDQELYDGTTTIFESIHKRPSTLIIPLYQGKVVITEQEQPNKGKFWAMAGGGIEPGEEPLENAKRELLEETGMHSDEFIHLATYEYGFKIDYKCHIYIAKNCQKIAELSPDPGEKIIAHIVTFAEFLDMISKDILQESRMLKWIFQNELSESCTERMTQTILHGKPLLQKQNEPHFAQK